MRLDQLEFASGKARSAWQLRGSRGAVVTLYHAQRQRIEDVSALLQSLASHTSTRPLYFGDHPLEEALPTFHEGDRQYTWSPQTALQANHRRLRKADDRYLATLKGLGEASGPVHRRVELEAELPEPAPPHLWPDGEARDMMLRLGGSKPLVVLFEILCILLYFFVI